MSKADKLELTKDIEEQLYELTCLARGNVDLVEEALTSSIKYYRTWKKFFLKSWYIDVEQAARYITERVKHVDGVLETTNDF